MNHFTYGHGENQDHGFLITENKFEPEALGKCEAVFCQGNGYMGIRNALEECYVNETRDTLVTGTFNKFDENEVTELPNFPDVTEVDIFFGEERFSMETGTLHAYSRTINLRNGEVVRKVDWTSPKGQRVLLTFRRFVSFADEHMIGARVEITPADKDLHVCIVSGINGRTANSGSQHFSSGTARIYENKYLEYAAATTQSKVMAAVYTTHKLAGDAEIRIRPVIDRRQVKMRYETEIRSGQTLSMEKISGIYTSRDKKYSALTAEAAEAAVLAESKDAYIASAEKGYDVLFAESASVWETFWNENDIRIDSSDRFDQIGIRFAQYHLNIMMKRDDNRVGIGAKAMTGEGYKGHSFWDTEVFLMPYYLFSDPKAARTLLEYRYKGLYGARKKAKENNLEGACYPWEAAWIDDGEVTPLYGEVDVVTGKAMPILTGMIELHITADVAYGVSQYLAATGDLEFLNAYGYEIFFETARFWLSKMNWVEANGRYEILDVIGPDEYKEHVNNNAYTNYMAAENLRLAETHLAKLEAENPALYEQLDARLNLKDLKQKLAEKGPKLYLPAPNEEGLVQQFDGFLDLKKLDLTKYKTSKMVGTIYHDYNMEQINTFQVCKQGDLVVLLFLMSSLFTPEQRRKNYEYYESCTLHDSSLSKCTHGILATDLGMVEEGYRFYQGSASIDLSEVLHSSDAGIHSASMGGIWQSVVMGFGGLRLFEGKLSINPKLPEAWTGLSYPVYYLGQRLIVEVTKEETAITSYGNQDVTILCGSKERTIPAGQRTVLTEG